MREVFFCVDAAVGYRIDREHANGNAVSECSQLFEAFHEFERMWSKRDPAQQCIPSVRVYADMLAHQLCQLRHITTVTQKWNWCPGEIERATRIRCNDLDNVGRRQHVHTGVCCGGSHVGPPVADNGDCAFERVPRHEWFITLHIENDVEIGEFIVPTELGDSIGAAFVRRVGKPCRYVMITARVEYLGIIRCDHDVGGNLERAYALVDTDDEGFTGEITQRFAR